MTTHADDRPISTAVQVRDGAAPLAPAAASYAGAALAVVVLALGVVGIRDALVSVGWTGGQRWIPEVLAAVDGAEPASWTAAAGVGVAVLGAVLIVAAVMPRKRRSVRAAANTAVYLDLTEVARLAAAAAESVAGVADARSTATRRTLTVRCAVTGTPEAGLSAAVRDAVSAELGELQPSPRIRVRLAKGDRR